MLAVTESDGVMSPRLFCKSDSGLVVPQTEVTLMSLTGQSTAAYQTPVCTEHAVVLYEQGSFGRKADGWNL